MKRGKWKKEELMVWHSKAFGRKSEYNPGDCPQIQADARRRRQIEKGMLKIETPIQFIPFKRPLKPRQDVYGVEMESTAQ